MIDYDAELQLHNEQFRAALGIRAVDRVLDIGCGTGQTTREAALAAPAGDALGVDIDAGMIAHARELADREGVGGRDRPGPRRGRARSRGSGRTGSLLTR